MFPQLTTTRFALLQITDDDQAFIFEGLSHPEVIPFYGVHYNSLEETAEQMQYYQRLWDEGSGIWWKIVDKNTGHRVGAIGFTNYQPEHSKAELGYWLLPAFWKMGIITEVLPVVLHHLFTTMKLHRVEALVEEGNSASFSVLEKTGFMYEGTLRDWEKKKGQFISLRMYSLLATDAVIHTFKTTFTNA